MSNPKIILQMDTADAENIEQILVDNGVKSEIIEQSDNSGMPDEEA